jgi:hypothetical protein
MRQGRDGEIPTVIMENSRALRGLIANCVGNICAFSHKLTTVSAPRILRTPVSVAAHGDFLLILGEGGRPMATVKADVQNEIADEQSEYSSAAKRAVIIHR